METSSVSNGSGLADTFAASAAAAAAAAISHPQSSHTYYSAGMGMISPLPPSAETLVGLSASANILGGGANSGLSNGSGTKDLGSIN